MAKVSLVSMSYTGTDKYTYAVIISACGELHEGIARRTVRVAVVWSIQFDDAPASFILNIDPLWSQLEAVHQELPVWMTHNVRHDVTFNPAKGIPEVLPQWSKHEHNVIQIMFCEMANPCKSVEVYSGALKYGGKTLLLREEWPDKVVWRWIDPIKRVSEILNNGVHETAVAKYLEGIRAKLC